MDIQLILQVKNSFGKYHPVFPKNPLKVCFLDCKIVNIGSGKLKFETMNVPPDTDMTLAISLVYSLSSAACVVKYSES